MSRIAIVLVALFGFKAGQDVRAEESKSTRPQWVIVVTIIDRASGQQLAQSKLTDRALVFDDASTCNSVAAQIHPIEDAYTTVVLTCRQEGSIGTETVSAAHAAETHGQVDQLTTQRVCAALAADPIYYFRHVDVYVRDGVATLSGYVWKPRDIYRARELTAHVPGVTRVVTQMEINRFGEL